MCAGQRLHKLAAHIVFVVLLILGREFDVYVARGGGKQVRPRNAKAHDDRRAILRNSSKQEITRLDGWSGGEQLRCVASRDVPRDETGPVSSTRLLCVRCSYPGQ